MDKQVEKMTLFNENLEYEKLNLQRSIEQYRDIEYFFRLIHRTIYQNIVFDGHSERISDITLLSLNKELKERERLLLYIIMRLTKINHILSKKKLEIMLAVRQKREEIQLLTRNFDNLSQVSSLFLPKVSESLHHSLGPATKGNKSITAEKAGSSRILSDTED